jgi:hypothetical protein
MAEDDKNTSSAESAEAMAAENTQRRNLETLKGGDFQTSIGPARDFQMSQIPAANLYPA